MRHARVVAMACWLVSAVLAPATAAQTVPVPSSVVVLLVAIRAQLDTMAAEIRADDTERMSCVTREADFTAGTTRYVIPLRLDTADVVARGQAIILMRAGGCADSLPTIHTHREHTPRNGWITAPSAADSATARAHPKARWHAVVTDSGRVILYGVRP